MPVRPLHIKNAHIWGRSENMRGDLYTSDVVLDQPAPDALPVDLDAYTIFPGFVNAHDHLELNHYPRSKFREVYGNAHQWGADMNARLDDSPYHELRAYPLEDRLFIGGLKNLLCGATTVAHHNAPHKYLFRADFPVRVLKKYGWAHSLHFSTDEEIVRSYRSTPPDAPWFIHLAEGTDEVAAGEYKRLKALGCAARAILIHAVGITVEDFHDLSGSISGLVWCPSTNLFLLGQTADIALWETGLPDVMLGSDSRLTAVGDLLDEIRVAMSTGLINEFQLFEMVYTHPAQKFDDRHLGHLYPAAFADWFALNADSALCGARRADLALVVKGGVPRIGDPDVMAKFPHVQTVPATLDGVHKAIHVELAKRILQCTLKEPGLEIDPDFRAKHASPLRKWFVFMRTCP